MSESLTIALNGPLLAVRAMEAPPAVGGAVAPGQAAEPASPSPMQQEMLDRIQSQMESENQKLVQARCALQNAAGKLAVFQESLRREAVRQLLELSVEIARKVLMQEIQAGRYEIDPIVQEAMGRISTRGEVVIRLNPDDYTRSELAGGSPEDGSDGIRFLPDPAVQPAECVLETPEGVIESRIESHLDHVSHALKAVE